MVLYVSIFFGLVIVIQSVNVTWKLIYPVNNLAHNFNNNSIEKDIENIKLDKADTTPTKNNKTVKITKAASRTNNPWQNWLMKHGKRIDAYTIVFQIKKLTQLSRLPNYLVKKLNFWQIEKVKDMLQP